VADSAGGAENQGCLGLGHGLHFRLLLHCQQSAPRADKTKLTKDMGRIYIFV
jgi:hypothetical protein